eukprot:2740523-Lingulodinium_polyedra.AAC.1
MPFAFARWAAFSARRSVGAPGNAGCPTASPNIAITSVTGGRRDGSRDASMTSTAPNNSP